MTLRNLIVNGNRNGGNVVGSDPRGGNSMWIPGVSLWNLSGVTLDNVDIYNAPTYHLIADNVTNLLIENSHFESTALSGGNNTDGVHVDGPSTGITISGSYFKTGDDAIAMNRNEGTLGHFDRDPHQQQCGLGLLQCSSRVRHGHRIDDQQSPSQMWSVKQLAVLR